MWFILAIWWLIKLAVYLGVGWWIYDDSKSRDRNPFFWIIAVALFLISDLFFAVRGFWTFIVFIIFIALYIFSRPKGELIYCVECFKKKLESLKYCPHCFHIEEDAFEEDNNDSKNDDSQNNQSEENQEKQNEQSKTE